MCRHAHISCVESLIEPSFVLHERVCNSVLSERIHILSGVISLNQDSTSQAHVDLYIPKFDHRQTARPFLLFLNGFPLCFVAVFRERTQKRRNAKGCLRYTEDKSPAKLGFLTKSHKLQQPCEHWRCLGEGRGGGKHTWALCADRLPFAL